MLLVASIAGLTVGYVMQRRAHDALGQQIKVVEREMGWASDAVRREQQLLERFRRKDVLLARAAQMGLGLSDIVSTQRVTIPLVTDPGWTTPVVTVPSTTSAATPGPLATAGGVPRQNAR